MQNPNDTMIGAVGIVDQAVLGLLDLKNTSPGVPPRSLLLEIFRLHNGLARRPNAASQSILTTITLLGTAGSTATRLLKEWNHVLRFNPTLETARSPARVYRIASLTAASLVTAWLLCRRFER